MALFLGVLGLLLAACMAALLRTQGLLEEHLGLALAFMWTPAVASVVARLALREGFQDVSFRLGGAQGRRAVLVAWLLPALASGLAYGVAWGAGLVAFSPPTLRDFGLEGLPPLARFGVLLAINLTGGLLISAVTATGEELGWRGYLLTRLVAAGVRYPVLWSGLIWWAWHLPLLVSGRYRVGPEPWLSPVLFLIPILAASYVMARLRLTTGSVWPAVMLHSSSNAVVQAAFDASSGDASLWVGESGLLVCLTSLLGAALIARWWAPRQPAGVTPRPAPGP
ncbi:CPBP family intramembrane glutamic endopeptidase [Corallococcus sp. AS-1-12]|uniref:CPBP family glutamic-type intramembrane protease n=1 Tax=Corallococcus sp. AS-1-12 TaxID=2874598 RepID=UPI001CBECC26|nr:CPBP family intramembrane metalloprotease [Corallococcus sp. AS-1-12]